MSNIIDEIEKEYMKSDVPQFNVGDTVRVSVKVKEGNRERIQMFEGIVIAKKERFRSRIVYRSPRFVRRRYRAHVPASLAAYYRYRRNQARQSTSRQTLLFAQSFGQSGKNQREVILLLSIYLKLLSTVTPSILFCFVMRDIVRCGAVFKSGQTSTIKGDDSLFDRHRNFRGGCTCV